MSSGVGKHNNRPIVKTGEFIYFPSSKNFTEYPHCRYKK